MKDKILATLKNVKYPGFDQDIITLDIVEEFSVTGDLLKIRIKPVHADEKFKTELVKNIEDAFVALNLKVEATFAGPAQAQPRKEPAPKKEIPGVKKIIPIASGKGGVGKSTVSANLAIALAKEGHKVGLLDLDVYGPSVPMMLGIEGLQNQGSDGKLRPVEKYGIKTMSIGFLLEKDKALIWRGPLIGKIIKQFFYDVEWGELDYLLLDLPPGTGDVQITLIQSLPIYGAVVVTTPQNVALADVEKAINMFNQTDSRILGIIENMSGFLCPHCEKESHIFGHGGGKKESERFDLPLLGEIPLEGKITETGDSGEPITLADGKVSDLFRGIARKLAEE